MKHFAFTILGLVLAVFAAQAQYLPTRLQQAGASLVNENGEALSNQEVLLAVGQQIFDETYVGAVKQYNAGRKLLSGGAVAMGAGLGVTVASAILFANADLSYTTDSRGVRHYRNLGTKGAVGYAGVCAGVAAIVTGFEVLSAGIVFKSIGAKRLQWVASDYNAKAPVAIRIGNGRYGTGVVVSF